MKSGINKLNLCSQPQPNSEVTEAASEVALNVLQQTV